MDVLLVNQVSYQKQCSVFWDGIWVVIQEHVHPWLYVREVQCTWMRWLSVFQYMVWLAETLYISLPVHGMANWNTVHICLPVHGMASWNTVLNSLPVHGMANWNTILNSVSVNMVWLTKILYIKLHLLILRHLSDNMQVNKKGQSLRCGKMQRDSVFELFAIKLRLTLIFHL